MVTRSHHSPRLGIIDPTTACADHWAHHSDMSEVFAGESAKSGLSATVDPQYSRLPNQTDNHRLNTHDMSPKYTFNHIFESNNSSFNSIERNSKLKEDIKSDDCVDSRVGDNCQVSDNECEDSRVNDNCDVTDHCVDSFVNSNYETIDECCDDSYVNYRYEVTDECVERYVTTRWDHVNGTYSSTGVWRPWNQMTSAVSFEATTLHILPYVDIDIEGEDNDNEVDVEDINEHNVEDNDMIEVQINDSPLNTQSNNYSYNNNYNIDDNDCEDIAYN